MARVLIAGCGYVGEAVAGRLARRGDTVFALRRSPAHPPAGSTPIAADLADRRALEALPSPLDAVVFAAAPASGDEGAYRAVYDRGLANLLAAVRRRGPRGASPRIVLLSSTSVYGQTAGEWVDESSPTIPLDFRGRIVLDGEERLRASAMPGVALRLGGIYGPGRTSLLDSVRAGRARVSSAGLSRITNRIHRDDVAGAIVHLLDLPDPLRPERAASVGPGAVASTLDSPETAQTSAIYIGVDEEPAERDQVLRWLAQSLRLPPLETAGDRHGTAIAPRIETSKRCSSAKLRASGYRFLFPTFRQGYAHLMRREEDGEPRHGPPIATGGGL